MVHMNASKAVVQAGYSPKGANVAGAKLLANPSIRSYIEQKRSEKSKEILVDRTKVLSRWAELAFRDPSDLVETKVGACRYCHGADHQYQWTQGEWMKRCEEIDDARLRNGNDVPEEHLDPAGGFGYDPRRDPHPDCTECFGEGVPRVVVGNSRGNPQYAGAKRTKDGLEVKIHDQMAALNNIAKNLGLLNDKVDLTADINVENKTNRDLAMAALSLFRKSIESK